MGFQKELERKYWIISRFIEYDRDLTHHDALKRRVIFSQSDFPDLPFALRVRVFNRHTNPYEERVHTYVDITRPVIVKWNDRILRSVASIDNNRGGVCYFPSVDIEIHRAPDYLSLSRYPEKGTISVSFELDTNASRSSPPTGYEVYCNYLYRFQPFSLVESSVRNVAMCIRHESHNLLKLGDDALPKALVTRINDHITRCSNNYGFRCRSDTRYR
jgi:hypothetical protein